MSDIERYYKPRAAARQHRRDLEELNRQAQLRSQRVTAKGHLTRQAIGEALMTALAVEEAAKIAPSGIPEYAMIAAIGAQALAYEVGSL